MKDDYKNIARPTLSGAAADMFRITPNNDEDLPEVSRGLRIFNDGETVETVTFVTYHNSTITISVPPQSLTVEDVLVRRVLATGTGAVVIHGYSD